MVYGLWRKCGCCLKTKLLRANQTLAVMLEKIILIQIIIMCNLICGLGMSYTDGFWCKWGVFFLTSCSPLFMALFFLILWQQMEHQAASCPPPNRSSPPSPHLPVQGASVSTRYYVSYTLLNPFQSALRFCVRGVLQIQQINLSMSYLYHHDGVPDGRKAELTSAAL